MAAGQSGTSGTPRVTPASAAASLRSLVWSAVTLEAFLLALLPVAPLGSLAFSVSPLARAWPWLLWPGRAVFGELPVTASMPPERGWPALALFAVLLVGASCAQALALLRAKQPGCDVRVELDWHVLAGARSRRASAGATGQKADRERMSARPRSADATAISVPAMRTEIARVADALALWAARNRALLLVMAATLIFSFTLFLLPSLPSDDVFSYTLYGRIGAVHHANPLTATPADFPSDPFLSQVYWRDVRSVYGPIWLLLSSALALLAQVLGGSLVVYVALFKLVGLGAHLANALLIWAILGRLAPRAQLVGTVLYAWSPLCLLEFCASGHNDAVMLTFLLVGVYWLVRGWEAPALVAFGLSVSTKYVPLILLPFYLTYIGYRMRRASGTWANVAGALGWRVALLLAVVVVTALPYWAGPRTLGALLFSPPAQQLDNSLLESISWPLRWLAQGGLHLTGEAARSLVDTSLKIGALLLFVVLWLRELRRATSLDGVISAWGWALLWYVLVASGWFWPWYVTWAVVIAAIAPRGRLTMAVLLTAAGALTLYAFLPLHASSIYGFRSVVAFAPVWGYLLAATWRRGWLVALWRGQGRWRVIGRTLTMRGS